MLVCIVKNTLSRNSREKKDILRMAQRPRSSQMKKRHQFSLTNDSSGCFQLASGNRELTAVPVCRAYL